MNKLNIIGLLLLIFISSCRKDINDVTENVKNDDPTVLVYTPNVDNITGSLIGQVVDENNQPMSDVKIKMNGEDYFTNEFGHFIINDATMNSLGQVVTAKQDATHFPGSRRFFPQEGVQSRVKIQMITKIFDAEFSAQESAEITIEGGAKVNFEPNSIKDSEGNIYEGFVFVASHWLNPTALETLDKMPGNLQGVNTLSEEVALQTFGMIAVELESPSGEKLNIADGKTATITMPIPDELIASSPEQIPLWSYNEEYGLWQEESSANLQNDTYVGEVSHFSFWNCDDPYSIIFVDATFTDPNGIPLNGHLVEVVLGNGTTGTGYIYNNGTINASVPANEILTFNLYDNCGDIIFSEDFGPFPSNSSLGTIVVDNSNVNNTVIKGTLRDCDNNLVQNGLIIATMDGFPSYHYITGGQFEFYITSCLATAQIEVVGVNMDNLEQGTAVSATAQTVNDLGDLSTCGASLENYMILTIDGDSKTVLNFTTNSTANDTYMFAEGSNIFVGIGFGGIAVGEYSESNFIEGIMLDDWNIQSVNPDLPSFSTFTVTQYDTNAVGTFSGQVENNGVVVLLEGEFNVNL
ncbi:MAG: hypothetical protein AB8F94_20840 [Saprospiraceae bacterium]